MIDRKTVVLLIVFSTILFSLTTNTFAQGIPPNILKIEVEDYTPGDPLRIKAIFTDEGPLGECLLYYRIPTAPEFDYTPFFEEYDYYVAEIPPEFLEVGHLEYYIYASDAEGNSRTSPEINPELNPYRFSMVSEESSVPTRVQLLSPEPGSKISMKPELIVISLFDPDEDTSPASVILWVDGIDVTKDAQVSPYLVTYYPQGKFDEGRHFIKISVEDYAGHVTETEEFTFSVQKFLTQGGGGAGGLQLSYSQETLYDNYSKDQPSNKPVDQTKPRIKASYNWGWLKADGELFYNLYADGDSRDYAQNRQTINRYRLELKTNPAKIILGDVNPRFSELTIKGTRIRGIYAEADYGPFGMNAFYGTSKHKIDPYKIAEGDSISDTLFYEDDTTIFVQYGTATPTYKRRSSGVRAAYYFARNSDTWLNSAEWAVSYLRFKDDTDDSLAFRDDLIDLGGYSLAGYDSMYMVLVYLPSLSPPITDPNSAEAQPYWDRWAVDNGSVEGFLGKPKDNIVGSTTLNFRIFKKTFISFETAVSMLNDNQYASRSIIEDSEDQAIIDQADWYDKNFGFTINNEINQIFPKPTFYADLRTPIPFTPTNIKLNYRRVPDSFTSLGNPSIQKDISAFKADTRSRFFKNKLSFNLGGEDKVDNLYNSKDKTTTTNSYYTSVGLVFPQYPTVNIGYRIITRDGEGLSKAPTDSSMFIKLPDTSYIYHYSDSVYTENTTSTITTALGYNYRYQDWSANANLNLMFMNYADTKNSEYNFANNSLMLSLGVISPWPVGADISFGNSVNEPDDPNSTMTVYNIMNGRLSYYFMERKFTTYLGFEYLTGTKDPDSLTPDGIDNTKTGIRLGFNWKINPKTNLSLEGQAVDFTDNTGTAFSDELSYSETRARIKFDIRL